MPAPVQTSTTIVVCVGDRVRLRWLSWWDDFGGTTDEMRASKENVGRVSLGHEQNSSVPPLTTLHTIQGNTKQPWKNMTANTSLN